EQRLLGLGTERSPPRLTCQGDRRSHLLDVIATTVATGNVLLEPSVIGIVQRALEIVRHELDELLAAQLFDLTHLRSPQGSPRAPVEPSTVRGGGAPADWSRSRPGRYTSRPSSTPPRREG